MSESDHDVTTIRMYIFNSLLAMDAYTHGSVFGRGLPAHLKRWQWTSWTCVDVDTCIVLLTRMRLGDKSFRAVEQFTSGVVPATRSLDGFW